MGIVTNIWLMASIVHINTSFSGKNSFIKKELWEEIWILTFLNRGNQKWFVLRKYLNLRQILQTLNFWKNMKHFQKGADLSQILNPRVRGAKNKMHQLKIYVRKVW